MKKSILVFSITFLLSSILPVIGLAADSQTDSADDPYSEVQVQDFDHISARWKTLRVIQFHRGLLENSNLSLDAYKNSLSKQNQRRFENLGIVRSQLDQQVESSDLDQISSDTSFVAMLEWDCETNRIDWFQQENLKRLASTCRIELESSTLVVSIIPKQYENSADFMLSPAEISIRIE